MKQFNFLWIFIVLVFGQSCDWNNTISFDVEQQKIRSCNKKGINRIYIEHNSIAEEYFKIEWQDNTQNSPTEITLNEIAKGYLITKSWRAIKINKKEFKLKPNSTYKIERAQGDASPYSIEVLTDSKGRVIKTNKSQCR